MMRISKKHILRYLAASLIIGASGCGDFFIRELPKDPSSTSDIKYDVSSISIAAEDVPVSFLTNLKRYLYSELSKRKLLGGKEDKPRHLHILIGYYRVFKGADSNSVVSMIDFTDSKTEALLGESEIKTQIQKIRNVEDVAKQHAKDIVKFLSGENKK